MQQIHAQSKTHKSMELYLLHLGHQFQYNPLKFPTLMKFFLNFHYVKIRVIFSFFSSSDKEAFNAIDFSSPRGSKIKKSIVKGVSILSSDSFVTNSISSSIESSFLEFDLLNFMDFV